MKVKDVINNLQTYPEDMEVVVIHGKIDVTANLAVSAVHSNKDMETPRRGIKQVHAHPLRGICNSHN